MSLQSESFWPLGSYSTQFYRVLEACRATHVHSLPITLSLLAHKIPFLDNVEMYGVTENMDWPPFPVLPLITLSSSGKQAHTVLPWCWCSKSLLRIKYNKQKQPSDGRTSNTLLMQHATSQSQCRAPDWFGSPLMSQRSKATALSEGGVISWRAAESLLALSPEAEEQLQGQMLSPRSPCLFSSTLCKILLHYQDYRSSLEGDEHDLV